MEELADCFIYMELIIEKHGHDITTFAGVIQDKINKNKERMQGRKKEYNGKRWEDAQASVSSV
jgi:NTP pyrophosphatase (non-canonical NTP hydrolase)